LFGWFGGPGYHATLDVMHGSLGIPKPWVVLVMLAEALGSLGLVFGAFARVAAFGISAVMIGAIVLIHRHIGFFMNWTGTQAGEGLEFHLLALALSVPLLLWGAGQSSVDGAIWRRLGRRAAPDRDFDRGAPVVGRKVTEEA
jgi:putative oxidoreductase